MMKCSGSLSAHLEKLADENKEFDARNAFDSFTLDVISSCLFGFETDAINEPNNEFLANLKKFFVGFSFKFLLLCNRALYCCLN